jgi:hypothetical protein
MVINVLTEDNFGGEVDQDELQEWADLNGMTLPVVSDPGMSYMTSFLPGATVISFPTTVILDEGYVVNSIGYDTIDEAVRQAELSD